MFDRRRCWAGWCVSSEKLYGWIWDLPASLKYFAFDLNPSVGNLIRGPGGFRNAHWKLNLHQWADFLHIFISADSLPDRRLLKISPGSNRQPPSPSSDTTGRIGSSKFGTMSAKQSLFTSTEQMLVLGTEELSSQTIFIFLEKKKGNDAYATATSFFEVPITFDAFAT